MDCKDTNNSQKHKFFRREKLAPFSRVAAEEFLIALGEVGGRPEAHFIGDFRHGFVGGLQELSAAFSRVMRISSTGE